MLTWTKKIRRYVPGDIIQDQEFADIVHAKGNCLPKFFDTWSGLVDVQSETVMQTVYTWNLVICLPYRIGVCKL